MTGVAVVPFWEGFVIFLRDWEPSVDDLDEEESCLMYTFSPPESDQIACARMSCSLSTIEVVQILLFH